MDKFATLDANNQNKKDRVDALTSLMLINETGMTSLKGEILTIETTVIHKNKIFCITNGVT